MKNHKIFSFMLAIIASALFFTALPAHAQRFAKNCERAESTSDTLVCVKKQMEAAQADLNNLYKDIVEAQPEGIAPTLGETQKEWITYRDAQCAWESALTDEGFAKIYEMSCIAALTEQRIKSLTAMRGLVKNDMPREFAAHPRWMNVLAADYPDVFWRYGQWTRADLDCNGTEEEVMTGVTIKARQTAQDQDTKENEIRAYSAEAVVALSENVKAGRSKTIIFRRPVGKQETGDYFCNVPLGLEILDNRTEIDISGAVGEAEEDMDSAAMQEQESCDVKIRILDGDCQSAMLYWNGTEYKFDKSKQETDTETQ